MQESKPPTEDDLHGQEKKRRGILERAMSFTFMFRFIGVCAVLAFLSTLVTVGKEDWHATYPTWIQVFLDAVNVFLIVATTIGGFHTILRHQYRSRLILLLHFCIGLATLTFVVYLAALFKNLPLMLFTALATFFLSMKEDA